jgi:phosphoribosylpyrophosphate synthetase
VDLERAMAVVKRKVAGMNGSGTHTPPLPGVSDSGSGGAGGGLHFTAHDNEDPMWMAQLKPRTGYKQWMSQAGSLVADLLTCAGADRVLTCDLHESTYQGFFDIPGMMVLIWG